MEMIPEDLMRKYKYGYVHSCKLLEEPFIKDLLKEIQELKRQLDYLRSSEYINQLRFERDMLQDIVDKGKVSEEDKTFIDCTHRNTELLEENKKKQDAIDKAIEYIENDLQSFLYNIEYKTLLDILKEVSE